jgi:cation diffusion facilitator CzcD-associated flavoprotein CzcO
MTTLSDDMARARDQAEQGGNRNMSNASVVIIGGGISGICTAIDLIRQNKTRNFIILEKSTQFGGTWNDNKYPGCCCDGKSPNALSDLN